MPVYGAKTPLGKRTIVCRLKSSKSSCLIFAATPSANSTPFGTTTAARPPLESARPGMARRSFRMMTCRNSSAVSEVRLSGG